MHRLTGQLVICQLPRVDHRPPESAPGAAAKMLPPEVVGVSISRWAPALEPPPDPSLRYAGLMDTVRQLREQHHHDRQQTREQLKRIRTARVHMLATRKQISEDALKRRHPPSS